MRPLPVAIAGLLLAACSRPVPKTHDGTTVTVTGGSGDEQRFDPGAPLGDPPAPDPKAFGLAYLEEVYAAIKDGWTTFLDDARTRLPAGDKLNEPTLEAKLQLTIDEHGALTDLTLLTGSGNSDFDATAQEVVQEAAPFPTPPRELLSDDGHLYVTWLFARDKRQAGVATAEVHREEWPVDRAVPKLIADGNLVEAAHRLDKSPSDELAVRVMVAALREGLESSDAAVQRDAVFAADELAPGLKEPMAPLVHDLTAISSGSLEIEVRAAAVRALGHLGADVKDELTEVLGKDAGHNAALSSAAAAALVELGDGANVAKTLRGWLGSGDRAQVGGALATLEGAAVPGLADDVAAHVADKDLGVRIAACRALARVAAGEAPAWKALKKGSGDRDASVRAACVESIAAVAAPGKNRTTYYALVPMFKDRDDHVRAAAVRAAATLEPAKVVDELGALRKETSPTVLVGLAAALGQLPGADVPKRLVELAGNADPSVRAAAASALVARGGKATAIAAKMVVDPDRAVRLAALPAIDDGDTLANLATDPDAQVAAAAAARRIAKLGRTGALADVLATIESTQPGSAARVSAAAAWLAAR